MGQLCVVEIYTTISWLTILHTQVMRKKKDFAHFVCRSCDAAEVFLIVAGAADTNRHLEGAVHCELIMELGTPSSSNNTVWTGASPRDKTVSVSQLVARFQPTMKESPIIHAVEHGEAQPKLTQTKPSLLKNKDTPLESLMKRNDERERSRTKPALTRSKSEGCLPKSSGSIDTLRALFESKSAAENKVKNSVRAADVMSRHMADMPLMNGGVEGGKQAAEEQKTQTQAKTEVKDQKNPRERRKTIGGIDFEKIAACEADEKRRSIADFRDSSFIQTKEKLSVSVKAMSALYLSKVAPQESKPEQDQSRESGRRVKLTKFQPVCQEMCSACMKPVYQMERVTTGKYTLHKTCFICKQCKKKLSMHNYTPLNGDFYCIFHYQQLFRRKGNYDEGFGRAQHKNLWLSKNKTNMNQEESEA